MLQDAPSIWYCGKQLWYSSYELVRNFWSRWARPSKNIRFCHAKRGTQQPQNHHFENFEAAAMDGQVLGDKVKELEILEAWRCDQQHPPWLYIQGAEDNAVDVTHE